MSLAETYLAVKTTHGMSNEALLTYVATRLQGDTVGAKSVKNVLGLRPRKNMDMR